MEQAAESPLLFSNSIQAAVGQLKHFSDQYPGSYASQVVLNSSIFDSFKSHS
jgi:hypothetical protein